MSLTRECDLCGANYRLRSHLDRRTKCPGCSPRRGNVMQQKATRQVDAARNAMERLEEMERKLEALEVNYQFYQNSIETMRDMLVEDIAEMSKKRAKDEIKTLTEDIISDRLKAFRQGVYNRLLEVEKANESFNGRLLLRMDNLEERMNGYNDSLFKINKRLDIQTQKSEGSSVVRDEKYATLPIVEPAPYRRGVNTRTYGPFKLTLRQHEILVTLYREFGEDRFLKKDGDKVVSVAPPSLNIYLKKYRLEGLILKEDAGDEYRKNGFKGRLYTYRFSTVAALKMKEYLGEEE